MLTKKDVVARPGGVYNFIQVKGLDWLASPLSATRFRQSMPDLASGPMGDGSLHTGPTSNAWRCAVDELDLTLGRLLAKGRAAVEARKPHDQPTAVWTYFIGSADQSLGLPIKIGMAKRVSFRLRELQLASPVRLEVLAMRLGLPSLEREYHRRFTSHRLHGEWFAPHPDILEEISRIGGQTNAPD